MNAATFRTIEAASAVMNRTGRTWTPVKVGGGFKVRANMPSGWRNLTEIDVAHIVNCGAHRVIRRADGSTVAVS